MRGTGFARVVTTGFREMTGFVDVVADVETEGLVMVLKALDLKAVDLKAVDLREAMMKGRMEKGVRKAGIAEGRQGRQSTDTGCRMSACFNFSPTTPHLRNIFTWWTC